MAQPLADRWISPEEYLETERRANYRSEYFDGEMFAMAGASRRHNRIVTNLTTALDTRLKSRPCNVYANDMRVYIPATGYFTYPDVVATCGEEEFTDARKDVLVNPLLIVEMLSDSTALYDRGRKFEQYREIESFVEYLLIDQHTPAIEQFFRRTSAEWIYTEIKGEESVATLRSIKCSLPTREVYHKVEWTRKPMRLRKS